MSKELEALKRLKENSYYVDDKNMKEDVDILEQALQRLKQIENANPSEAIECLHKIASKVELADNDDYWEVRNAYAKVENTLVKAQEQEKGLEIIKEKHFDDYMLTFETYEEYQENANRVYEEQLVIDWSNEEQLLELNLYTKDEFDTLKRWIGNV